jgi:hypothetical protein
MQREFVGPQPQICLAYLEEGSSRDWGNEFIFLERYKVPPSWAAWRPSARRFLPVRTGFPRVLLPVLAGDGSLSEKSGGLRKPARRDWVLGGLQEFCADHVRRAVCRSDTESERPRRYFVRVVG